MVLLLLKLVFFVVSVLSDLVTRVIFATAAHVLVQMIQLITAPGKNSLWLLEQVRDVIKTCLEYLVQLVIHVISTLISSLFDAVKEGVLNSSSGVASVVAELLVKLRTSLEEAVQQIPEVMDAFAQMIGKVVADALNNCNAAIAYVSEKALK